MQSTFKRGGSDIFAKLRNVKIELLSGTMYFCKKGKPHKEIHEDFMETLGKERSLLLLHREKWASEFKRGRENVEDDGRSGRPKDATTDESVEVVHILVMCDRRRDMRNIAS